MNNFGKILICFFVLIFIISTFVQSVSAQENETKEISQVDGVKQSDVELLLFGWLLGVLSFIIEPFIIEPIREYRNRKNFQKNLRADIKIKKTELENKKQTIISFAEATSIDDAIRKFTVPSATLPSFYLAPKIPDDFYNKNYENFLDGFDKEIKFYQAIQFLNLSIDGMEKVNNIMDRNYRLYLLLYMINVKSALLEGANITT